MEITILGTLPPIKGMSDVCLNQIRYLQKEVRVTFINFNTIYPELLYPGGTKDYSDSFILPQYPHATVNKIIDWYNPLTWIKAGLSIKGNIMLFHWWTSYLFPVYLVILLIAKLKKVILVCEIHNVVGHETGFIDRWFIWIIMKLSDFFIVHSMGNKQKLIRMFRIDQNKITVIPMGVLSNFGDKIVTKLRARIKLKIPKNAKVVLYFGYIRKYKGVDVLIKAFKDVKEAIPHAILMIVGVNWLDWKPLQNLIERYHLEKNILINLTYIPNDEVKYYYSACDTTVFPYRNYEAQCGPGLIALAFGKPLIVSQTGGLPELVKSKEVVLPPGDYHVLARTIIKVLKENKFRKKLEQESKDLAKVYSWENYAHSLVKLLRSLDEY